MIIETKEAFCGLTLRTGTLVLLTTVLVVDGFLFWVYSSDLLYDTLPIHSLEIFFDRNVRCHHFIGYTLGVISSLLGIFSIQENTPKHLIYSFIYFCYYVLYYIFGVSVLIFAPNSYRSIIWGESLGYYNVTEVLPVVSNIYLYLCLIGLMSYFALVVRCCRNSMMDKLSIVNDVEIAKPEAVH